MAFFFIKRQKFMVAVDVMGGDHAPDAVLQGALAAAKNSVPVALFGPQALISDWLCKHEPLWERLAITIVDAPECVAMDEDPVSAVRKKSRSSLVQAVASVAGGQSSIALSAGNSGALMAAAALIIGRSPGVERPAIAGLLPTSTKNNVLVLDLGANTECRASHLQTFAHLGSDYLQRVFGIQSPRIGLLSNGHEAGKGSQLVKEVYTLLQADRLNFIGNVEPGDVFAHRADVVVCDGFSGNVLLKTMEAIADLIAHSLGSDHAAMIDQRFTHKKMHGALLLGVNRPVIVCHGNADAQAIEQAIQFAWSSRQ